jgi:hypothetical protein
MQNRYRDRFVWVVSVIEEQNFILDSNTTNFTLSQKLRSLSLTLSDVALVIIGCSEIVIIIEK